MLFRAMSSCMNLFISLPKTVLRKAGEYYRKLWVRVVLMGLLAFLAVGITQLVEPLVPEKLATSLTGEAADRLLQIIANAMLAVTIFSITVMVSVYRSSSAQWTPRIHRLIIQDRTTQNTLAIFIGAYVYGLLAIILRELGVFVDDRAFVLFLMTVLVLAVIVFYLIRWVLHLQTFGSLIDTTRQIEAVTLSQFKDRLANPCLGARALTGDIPDGAFDICAKGSGYIQHIYPEALNEAASKSGVQLYLIRNIGSFVFMNEPVIRVVAGPDKEGFSDRQDVLEKTVCNTVVIGDVRTFEQDPRFGLMVMGEIGSKALSPGVNDPGTAIDVITRVGRILSAYKDETQTTPDTLLGHLFVRPLDPRDMLQDGFGALSRDGPGIIEVQLRLQHTLKGLMQHPDAGLRDAAVEFAQTELRRALSALDFEPDRQRLKQAVGEAVRAGLDDKVG